MAPIRNVLSWKLSSWCNLLNHKLWHAEISLVKYFVINLWTARLFALADRSWEKLKFLASRGQCLHDRKHTNTEHELSEVFPSFHFNEIFTANKTFPRSQVVAFSICWAPIQVILVLKSLRLYETTTLTVSIQIISHVLAYLNSCLNPFLYGKLEVERT